MYLLKQLFRLIKVFSLSLEKNKLLLLGTFTIMYLVVTYILSKHKPLWNDELYTYYIARLPKMNDVWGALMSGGEQLPPFFYVVTRISTSLFGLNTFGLWMPSIIGFWLMCVCLFVFIARRTSNYYALVAAIFPLVTFAYYYSYEARPYGLVLGFSSLALLCWQSITMNRLRLLSIICLAASLAGALSSHYYGIFAIFPLALGETARTILRRRIDGPVWMAFCIATIPLVQLLPLIQQARSYSTAFWAKAAWMNIPGFYNNLLFLSTIPFLLLLFISWAYQATSQDKELNVRLASNINPPIFEAVAAFGFIITPVICVIAGKLITGAFTERYAIIAVIGFSILVTFCATKLNDNSILVSFWIVIAFVMWFGFLAFTNSWAASQPGPQTKIQLLKRKGVGNLPIVAADPHTFVELAYYAPEFAPRVIYLADPAISLIRLQTNSIEQGMVDLIKPWFHLNVIDYKSYIATRQAFLLCGDPGLYSWIIPQLYDDGMQMDLKGFDGNILLFLVSPPTKSTDHRVGRTFD
jgi:hypothetical protein